MDRGAKKKIRFSELHETKKTLRSSCLHTVCEEARCPNIAECFSKHTATFMIMGDTCTRDCVFCNVRSGVPGPLDPNEPKRLAHTAEQMGLRHVVVTSVTRDDLPDGGASHFAETIRSIRSVLPSASIEVLVPDLKGVKSDIDKILLAGPDVFNHNIETVRSLSRKIRPQADYDRSLSVLKYAASKGAMVKSGLMLGLGETVDEVYSTLKELLENGVRILTIGQYFSPKGYPVSKYYSDEEFENIGTYAKNLGFDYVFSGVYVRSSYMASEVFSKI